MAHYVFHDGLRLRQKVRAVIIDSAGMLLLVRPHGYRTGEWTLAGGGVEHGESPEEAVARELAEELGLYEWQELSRLATGNRFIYTPEHKAKRALDHDGQDAVMFFVRLPQKIDLHLQEAEVAEASWFTRAEALGVLPVLAQRAVLEACLMEITQLGVLQEVHEDAKSPRPRPRGNIRAA